MIHKNFREPLTFNPAAGQNVTRLITLVCDQTAEKDISIRLSCTLYFALNMTCQTKWVNMVNTILSV